MGIAALLLLLQLQPSEQQPFERPSRPVSLAKLMRKFCVFVVATAAAAAMSLGRSH
eukprot:m.50420 g.50420  ORF g.50420 m.50420 type:complete len:56 (-) comp12903_c0_seq2:47-214(-)